MYVMVVIIRWFIIHFVIYKSTSNYLLRFDHILFRRLSASPPSLDAARHVQVPVVHLISDEGLVGLLHSYVHLVSECNNK